MSRDGAVFRFEPRSPAQAEAWKLFPSCRVLFLLGPAGTGKSHLALALALREVFEGRAKKVWWVRPAVTAGEDLGFLPGELDSKYRPFLLPLEHVRGRTVFNLPEGVVEPLPLAFLQGTTFLDGVAVLDEAQNATFTQLKMFLSRLGRNSKLVLAGDPEQPFISCRDPDYLTDLERVADRLEGLKGIRVLDFPAAHTLRDPLVADLLRALS